MRRAIILGGVVVTALVIATALLFARRYRLAVLTSTELLIKQPEQRRILDWAAAAKDCSKLQRALALRSQPANFDHRKLIKSTAPLSIDEIEIYRATIRRWVSGGRTSLNVSNATVPFDAASPRGLIDCECSQGIQVEALLSASRSFHYLTPEILLGKHMKLVDATKQITIVRANDPSLTIGKGKSINDAVREAFASGLFSMSEIVFDEEHHRALVTYSYNCGLLCGSGATLLFEKVRGEWKKIDRTCGGWIS